MKRAASLGVLLTAGLGLAGCGGSSTSIAASAPPAREVSAPASSAPAPTRDAVTDVSAEATQQSPPFTVACDCDGVRADNAFAPSVLVCGPAMSVVVSLRPGVRFDDLDVQLNEAGGGAVGFTFKQPTTSHRLGPTCRMQFSGNRGRSPFRTDRPFVFLIRLSKPTCRPEER